MFLGEKLTFGEKGDRIFLATFIVILTLISIYHFSSTDSKEVQFKITKEVCEQGNCNNVTLDNEVIWFDENTSFSRLSDGVNWLDKNCECKIDRECSVHYNKSQINNKWVDTGSGTYNGPIEMNEDGGVLYFQPGAQVIEECTSCNEYLCKDYSVEVIR